MEGLTAQRGAWNIIEKHWSLISLLELSLRLRLSLRVRNFASRSILDVTAIEKNRVSTRVRVWIEVHDEVWVLLLRFRVRVEEEVLVSLSVGVSVRVMVRGKG